MIKIDFKKVKEFLLRNMNKILLILALIGFTKGTLLLNQEIESIKQDIKINRALINNVRQWNKYLDKKIKKNREAIEEEHAY